MKNLYLSSNIQDLLNKQNKFEPEMVLASLQYWLSDHDQVRSPFPLHMKDKLPELATRQFIEWTNKLTPEAKKEINDEILVEKFEEILFSQAQKFAENEEEKLTIQYPFLIRAGDVVIDKNEKSTVASRKIKQEGDHTFMEVELVNEVSKTKWNTSFELHDY